MSAAEVQSKFFEDHARIAGKVAVLRSLATQVLRGDDELGGALRLKGRELQMQLIHHMKWEEETLFPMLGHSSDCSEDLADTLATEHQRQRVRLTQSLIDLAAADRRPSELATEVLNLARRIEQDMRDEEERVVEWMNPAAIALREPWGSGTRFRFGRGGA